MTGELVGTVTEEEKNEILVLYERKMGIEELAATLDSDLLSDDKKESLQDKMIAELGKVTVNMQLWWDRMYEKYRWKSIHGHKWNIDFQTCEIFLIE
ncbi:CXXX repeat peptide modification system protein [Ruminiclostridium cellobioparum]|uniref:CXXX repeat peptide modification system protein n=1 Tax=Ruminiclostridium cellobioparum subsp. termitidis CT1112 TaxID=1195236 RepID=S0FFI5_RUMCE|nr:CXXX repeat peptide modification system protein [Ruminiclostridium cellobioparum]EMS69710.1 CXXX repeat peptide modification system protein [Ruminiclostridium cellobioparum subsp. termitidis CT1112]